MTGTGRINRIGWFFEGRIIGWDVEEGTDLRVDEDGKVKVGGVEIVPWSRARAKSLVKKQWIVPGVDGE